MAEQSNDENVTVSQPPGGRFALDQAGGVALFGAQAQPPLAHQLGGQVVHATNPQQPLVHMVCWNEERPIELRGKVALVGDEHSPPLRVHMTHEVPGTVHQSHHVQPLEHALRVDTALAKPIHHALQLRTPLQLRFCNAWHLASDYVMEIRLWDNRVLSVRLTGATVASPQPCADDTPCPPLAVQNPPG